MKWSNIPITICCNRSNHIFNYTFPQILTQLQHLMQPVYTNAFMHVKLLRQKKRILFSALRFITDVLDIHMNTFTVESCDRHITKSAVQTQT